MGIEGLDWGGAKLWNFTSFARPRCHRIIGSMQDDMKAEPERQRFRPILARLGEVPDLCGISLGKGKQGSSVAIQGFRFILASFNMYHPRPHPLGHHVLPTLAPLREFGPEKLGLLEGRV